VTWTLLGAHPCPVVLHRERQVHDERDARRERRNQEPDEDDQPVHRRALASPSRALSFHERAVLGVPTRRFGRHEIVIVLERALEARRAV
jgi:hypothetical protein